MHDFKEGESVYYITGRYPKQIIEHGKIEFFFDHTSNINGIEHIEQLACILMDSGSTKAGRSVATLFHTADDARTAINAGLENRRLQYRTEISQKESNLENLASFALAHNVTENTDDPIAREIILEYCQQIGLSVPEK